MEGHFKKILLYGALSFIVFYIKTAYGATEVNTILVTENINTTIEITQTYTTLPDSTQVSTSYYSDTTQASTNASTESMTNSTMMDRSTALTSTTSSATTQTSETPLDTTQSSTTYANTTQTSETPLDTTQVSTTSASTTQVLTTSSNTTKMAETPLDTTQASTTYASTAQALTTSANTTQTYTTPSTTIQTSATSSTMTQTSRTPASTTSKTTPPFTSAKTVRTSTSLSGTTETYASATSSKGSTEEQLWYKKDWVVPVFACVGAVILVMLLCLVYQCGRQGNIGKQLTMIGSGERLRRWSHRVTQTFDTNNQEDRDVEDGHNVNMSSFTKPQINTAKVDKEKLPEKNNETKLDSTNVQSTETAEQASEVVDIEHKKLDNTNVNNLETEEASAVDDGGEQKKLDTTDVQNAGTEQALDTGNTKSAGDETLEKSPVESKSINQEEEIKPSTAATLSAETDKLIQRDDDVKSGEVNPSAELSDATDADAANTTHSTEPISEL